MVLDGPAHCALSVITLIALSGSEAGRTAGGIAGELDVPAPRVTRALRDLTAAGLLELTLAPGRVGYRIARPPADVSIADIIEAAAAGQRTYRADTPAARARRSMLHALSRVTLKQVLTGQTRRVD
jgi:DNA-binding IscR family transcriptional regulator